MKMKIALLALAMLNFMPLEAQKLKFGKVDKKELEMTAYDQDPEADAVVLYKNRRTFFEYKNTTGWNVITEVFERVKIFNQEGFDNAERRIRLYHGDEDQLFSIKAYTYTLDNGKIVKTKLEKSDIYEDMINENWKSKNFNMPNLQEGCVVEWKYRIDSPYWSYIQDVVCQYDIPIKQLECKVQMPEIFVFNHAPSRYYNIPVTKKRERKNYSFADSSREVERMGVVNSSTSYGTVDFEETLYIMEAQNIPALKEEPYVNNINNYRAVNKFEVSAYRPKYGAPKFYNTTWDAVSETIFQSAYFGRQIDPSKKFEEQLIGLYDEAESDEQKISKIYEKAKSAIIWDGNYGIYTDRTGISRALKDREGNVAEVNLNLTALLKTAGFNAHPVLVSTRDHGIPIFPTKDGFNYVVVAIEKNDQLLLLDATERYGAPNVLPYRALNWQGRMIRSNGSSKAIELYPKTYNYKKTKLNAKLSEDGSLSGILTTTYANQHALNYRSNRLGLSEEDKMIKIEEDYSDIEIDKIRIVQGENPHKPLTEMVQFSADQVADVMGNKVYFNPLLFLTVQENPFKLESRSYPIDYASAWKDDIQVEIQLPQGFTVESAPEDAVIELPNNMGSFKLSIKPKNNMIQVESSTFMNKAIIGSAQYQTIKDFYKKSIEKQLEQIILVETGP